MKQKYEEFRKKCYEKYQLNWMLSHGYSLQDLIDAMNEKYIEDDSREYTTPGCYYEDVLDNDGFHGELFHYYDAFLEKEYLDGKYMKSILTESEFQTWRDDTEQYETSLIQKKMEDRVIFLQKETSRLNFNIQSLDKKIILLNEEKLEEHDKN